MLPSSVILIILEIQIIIPFSWEEKMLVPDVRGQGNPIIAI
jgi:hypothetical protein